MTGSDDSSRSATSGRTPGAAAKSGNQDPEPPVDGGISTQSPAAERGPATAERNSSGSPDNLTIFLHDVVVPVGAVLLLGLYLLAITGVWPPMVAIESGSMEPNMNVNDLVLVMDTDRFQSDNAEPGTGVVTAETGATVGYSQFGHYGDVIVYEPNGNSEATPVIHRAMFWVEADEDWIDRADDAYLGGAESCDDVQMCPAPHDGFITKGDNNRIYDQLQTDEPVRPEWVIGSAEFRIPGLGYIRLRLL